jgi:hypothetical protein
MSFVIEPYSEQMKIWPSEDRHILAQFDDETIIVYQAYRPDIGLFAAKNGLFGGAFSYSRMSWIKPNFLWMMYRSGWGTKEGQEITLGLRLRRSFFDSLSEAAVPSTWDHDLFDSKEEWSRAVAQSSVRLQWDPDHHPNGAKLERRAIQLGLRGGTLEAFGRKELVEVMNLTDFVAEQRMELKRKSTSCIQTPKERVYRPKNDRIASWLRLHPVPTGRAVNSPG